MPTLRLIGCATIAALISACGPRQVDQPTAGEEQAMAAGEVVPVVPSWSASLSPVTEPAPAAREDGAAVAGSVDLEMGDTREQSRVMVHLTGLLAGTYPWHVHSGTCESGGPIVGPATAYPPLTVGANGEAHLETMIPVATPTGGEHHVNVHRSQDDLGTIVACGNLHVNP